MFVMVVQDTVGTWRTFAVCGASASTHVHTEPAHVFVQMFVNDPSLISHYHCLFTWPWLYQLSTVYPPN